MRTSTLFSPFLAQLHGFFGVEHGAAAGGPRAGVQAFGQDIVRPDGVFFRLRIKDRRQELVQGVGIEALDGRLLVDQLFFHHLHGDAQGGKGRALSGAGLEHPELSLLDRELDVLHVLEMLLQTLMADQPS